MLNFFVILSVSSIVIQNCVFNNICKKELKTNDDIYRFNMIVYTVCIALFGIFLFGEKISLYTIAFGVLFGIVTALGNQYKMLSLSNGPMHITLLITTSSMIIPTMSGIFFGESFSIQKFCIVFILIGFIYLSLGKNNNTEINKRWFLYCSIAFVLMGSIGVLQKIHQTSIHKNELNAFLFVSFICSFIFSKIRIKEKSKNSELNKKSIALAIVCGFCTYSMNFLNLKLSGMLPSQLFFPLINGSAIILSSFMSVIIFKEKLSKKQLIGLCGGILSLIAICIVK